MSRKTNDTAIHSGLRILRRGVIVLGLLLAPAVVLTSPGEAQGSICTTPAEQGSWTNYNSQTRGITRLDFRMACRRATPVYSISMFSCAPICDGWNEVRGERLTGNLDGWYRFVYDQGFARRYVYARTYPQWPGWLRLWVYTDFVDSVRADYVMDEWFR
jgi:hypothetical protein